MKFLNILLVVLFLALTGVVIAIVATGDNASQGRNRRGRDRTSSSSALGFHKSETAEDPVRQTEPTTSSATDNESYSATSSSTQPDTSADRTEEWSRPKEWYGNFCNSIRKNVRTYLDGPYTCDRSLANHLLTLVSSIGENINSWSPETVENQCKQLGQEFKRFRDGCSWRSGVRHPDYDHVISAEQQGSWCAESGWEFVNPGTSDLSVRKVKVAHRCTSCRGSGQLIQRNRCPYCGGRGRVDNPAAFAAQAAVDIAGLFAKKGRRHSLPTGPRTIPCSNCQGRGQIQTSAPCNACGGSGQILR